MTSCRQALRGSHTVTDKEFPRALGSIYTLLYLSVRAHVSVDSVQAHCTVIESTDDADGCEDDCLIDYG